MQKTLAGKKLGEIGFRLETSPNKSFTQQACLYHQHEMQYNCSMTISIRRLWFANSTTKIMKED
jgi:hypothetical protein